MYICTKFSTKIRFMAWCLETKLMPSMLIFISKKSGRLIGICASIVHVVCACLLMYLYSTTLQQQISSSTVFFEIPAIWLISCITASAFKDQQTSFQQGFDLRVQIVKPSLRPTLWLSVMSIIRDFIPCLIFLLSGWNLFQSHLMSL